MDKSNLITLMFDEKDKDGDVFTIVDGVPKEITLFLEEGHWAIRGFLFEIGVGDHGRLSYADNPHGPIGVYDRTNVAHLKEIADQIREFTERLVHHRHLAN